MRFAYSGCIVLCYAMLVGCAHTKYNQTGPCGFALRAHDRCLVLASRSENEDDYFSVLQPVFKKRNIEVKFMPAEEWSLRASGIINPLDSTSLPALKKLGYTHFLLAKELTNQSGQLYGYYTPFELYGANYADPNAVRRSANEPKTQSQVVLQLAVIDNIKLAHTIVAKTTISPVSVRDKHKGETHVNLGSTSMARNKAIRKAAKRMLKHCTTSLAVAER